MAYIKFKDYGRLERAVAQAEKDLERKQAESYKDSHSIRYATERLAKVQELLDMYNFSRCGAIYINSDDISIIKYFSV